MNSIKPSVSVVMPAYNAAAHIIETLKSVAAQSYADFELIVVDDCSSDATPEIVGKFSASDERVKLVRLSKNFGAPAGPRNTGIRAARGEWIAFIDADDIWHPKKLECQMRVLAETGSQFCSSQMLDFERLEDLNFRDPGEFGIERISFMQQLIKFRTPTSSVVVKKELIAACPFNEDLRYKAREDLDCWLRCHEIIGSSIKVKHPLIGYRIVAGQISGKKWTMVRRHFFVLDQYRRRSGAGLGVGAYLFTLSHFVLAIYYRAVKRSL